MASSSDRALLALAAASGVRPRRVVGCAPAVVLRAGGLAAPPAAEAVLAPPPAWRLAAEGALWARWSDEDIAAGRLRCVRGAAVRGRSLLVAGGC